MRVHTHTGTYTHTHTKYVQVQTAAWLRRLCHDGLHHDLCLPHPAPPVGRLLTVHFTPTLYKHLCEQPCTLDDLKEEDATLHRSAKAISNSTDMHTVHIYVCTHIHSRCVTSTLREKFTHGVSCSPVQWSYAAQPV